MKRIFALGLGLAAFAIAPQAAKADNAFADPICDQATPAVRAYVEKTKDPNTTLDVAVDYAQKVADAYQLCAAEMLSKDQVENLQYAHLSEAQYDYVVGGWQHLAGNEELARAALQKSVKLAQDIIDWRPPSQNWYASNNVNVGSGSDHNPYSNGFSKYRDAATKVRDAANKSISMLAKPGAPAPK